jgi:hypothetical protein
MFTTRSAPGVRRTSAKTLGTKARPAPPPARAGLTAALLAAAGVLFVVYPALRPYSSETELEGALAFASDRWVLAHVCGMIAFGFLAAACVLTTSGASRTTQKSTTQKSTTQKSTTTNSPLTGTAALLGVALILPYYGAEAFGLHAIGEAAVTHGAANLAEVAEAVRYQPVALTLFGAGWIVLAAAGIGWARMLWERGPRMGAALIGAGMVLYLPQFFLPPWLRIAHGVVLGAGLAAVAIAITRAPAPRSADGK